MRAAVSSMSTLADTGPSYRIQDAEPSGYCGWRKCGRLFASAWTQSNAYASRVLAGTELPRVRYAVVVLSGEHRLR
jgi:hypothetical protein